MKQIAIATMWGLLVETGGRHSMADIGALLDRLKSQGYGGIEINIAWIMKIGSSKLERMLLARDMVLVAIVFSSGPPACPGNLGFVSEHGIEHPRDDLINHHNVDRHKAVWRGQVEEAAKLKRVLLQVTSHTGKDWFSCDEASSMLQYCLDTEVELGLVINHETHRSRILHSPWVISAYLEAHPALHLVADYSHYCCVAELGAAGPYTTPLQAVIARCNTRARHIHTRVGFEEGPQVPDPRSETWRPYFEGHMAWWADIISQSASRGAQFLTTTAEFGPSPYAWTDPYKGNASVANVWEVNHWVAQQVCALFSAAGHESAHLVDDPKNGVWDFLDPSQGH